jgi:hypothetical protein
MIAPDRVVMRDSPAIRNHGVERRALDCQPLRAELAWLTERVDREIGRGAVGIACVKRQVTWPLRPVVSRIAFPVAALIAS